MKWLPTLCFFALPFGAALATDYTWIGAAGGRWTDAANWTSGALPGADDRVFVTNGTVTVDARIAPVHSITVGRGATITCSGPFTNADDCAMLHLVCHDLTVERGGRIDATQKGWSGGRWEGTPPADASQLADPQQWTWKSVHSTGYGPGTSIGYAGWSGADHGGLGGSGRILDRPRSPYGDARQPTTAGSGGDLAIAYGGEVHRDISAKTTGFCRGWSGGGVIRIEATGSVRVDGEIRADGKGANNSGYNRDTASAGGSVWISCRTISGSGTISAVGGSMGDPRFPHFYWRNMTAADGRYGHPGGGGRIALDYDSAAQAAADVEGLFVTAAAGEYHSSYVTLATRDRYESAAEPGTLSFSDTALVKRLFGKGLSGRVVGLHELAFDGDLDFRRGFFRPAEEGFVLTVGGNLTVTNAAARLEIGGLQMTNRAARATVFAGTHPNRLVVGGNLLVSDGGSFALRAAQVEGEVGDEKWGGFADIAGTLTIGSNGWVYAVSDGINLSAPKFDVGALVIREGGTLSADRCGGLGKDFHTDAICRLLLGKTLAEVNANIQLYHGYGPVWGTNEGGGGYKCNAAGHGGRGGRSFSTNPGSTYGIDGGTYDDPWFPVLPGSGGSSMECESGSEGGTGGGLVYVTATGSIIVKGVVSADGWCGMPPIGKTDALKNLHRYSPGSGGAVFLFGESASFGPRARVSAKGGSALQGPNGSSWQATGGGGRIAVWTGRRRFLSDTNDVQRLAERPAAYPDVFDASAGDPLLLTEDGKSVTTSVAQPTAAQLATLSGKTGTVSFGQCGIQGGGEGVRRGLFVLLGTPRTAVTLPTSVPAIRRSHPRLFFNADTWPSVKAAAEGPARASRDALLARCDGYPDEPVCSGTEPIPAGHASAVPIADVKEWGSQAAECALAWRLTGDERYLNKAKRMLTVSIAAYQEAYNNRRAVSWYSTSRILALCAYDWIFYALTDEERRALIVPLVNHVEDVQPGDGKPAIVRRNGGPTGYRAGHYGVDSLLWYSGVAAAGDRYCDELAQRHLTTGYGYMRQLFAYRQTASGDDGPLPTGTSTYALGEYPWAHFNYFHTLRSAAGLDAAAACPQLAYFPNYVWWQWIRSDLFPMEFGSGDVHHAKNDLTVGRLNEHLANCTHFYGRIRPEAARLAATLRQDVPKTRLDATWPMYPYLLANESVQPYTDDEVSNASIRARRFESTGQIMMRSGWRSDATYCLFTAGGWITEHRHYDENNFVIYKNGFLALDTGSRASQNDYNLEHYYAQTVAHNCVLIHKPNEPLPRHWGIRSSDLAGRYCDGGQTVRGVSRVLAFETDALYTYVAADATAAYPTKGAEVVRQFLHLTDDCFVIYDRVESTDAAYDKEWLLHTEEEPTIDGALMMTTVRNGGTLYCRTLLPAEATLEKIGGSGQEFWSNGRNWEIDAAYLARQRAACQSAGSGPWFGQWRLSVRPVQAATQDRFLHVINVSGNAASGAVASSVSSDEDGDCAEIDLPNVTVGGQTGRLKATVRFNRTGPVGGGIRYRLLDGQGAEILTGTRPFTDTVEPQSGVFNR